MSTQTLRPRTRTALDARLPAVAVTLMFVVNGMVLGGYGGSLPSLRDKLGIDETQIAVLLFCAGLAGIASMQVGGRLADSIGARTITLAAMPILLLAMLVLAFAPTFGVALVGAVLMGLA